MEFRKQQKNKPKLVHPKAFQKQKSKTVEIL